MMADHNERQRRWDEMRQRVECVTDKLGKPIDAGIRETIVAFRLFGIHTTASCEGHTDWGVGAPWIDVHCADYDDLTARRQDLRVRPTRSRTEQSQTWAKQLERNDLQERQKLFVHLDAFYRGREVAYDQRLVLEGWRLQSQGARLQAIATDAEEKRRKLAAYQQEMRAFTAFLKRRLLCDGLIDAD